MHYNELLDQNMGWFIAGRDHSSHKMSGRNRVRRWKVRYYEHHTMVPSGASGKMSDPLRSGAYSRTPAISGLCGDINIQGPLENEANSVECQGAS